MKTEDARETEDEKLRRQLEWLFGGYSEHDPADELRTISRYIEYVAERIDHEKVVVAVQPDLLNQFESVCLLVLDRLQLHPEPVRGQVEEILRSERIARTLALIAMLSPEQRRRLAQPTAIHAVITRFGGYWARRFGLQDEPLLQPGNLLETKIALNRVAQILKYAATVPLLDYDSGSRDLRDHYDPSLIGKAKVLALLNVVRTQAADVEDESVRRKIEARLDELENEVRKARPRWGRIIAGVFVLFSFVADLKSISPGVYDQITRQFRQSSQRSTKKDPFHISRIATARRCRPVRSSPYSRREWRSRMRTRTVRPNFGVKLARPGLGPAAELPMSSPA